MQPQRPAWAVEANQSYFNMSERPITKLELAHMLSASFNTIFVAEKKNYCHIFESMIN